jgi:osmoprotectant transport system permease protein
VNLFVEAFRYIATHLSGQTGVVQRLGDHAWYSGLSLLVALAIALPIGLLVGHTGRGRNVVVAISSATRALPTLGLLYFIVLLMGLGLAPLIIVLVLLAVPPILAGAYAGLESVDRQTIDAARSIGLSEWQILSRVEVPLALPLILGGIRSAVLQVIATATIASYFGLTGLGRFLAEGLAQQDYSIALAGAILVAALAAVVDGALALIQILVTPRGVSRGVTGATVPLPRAHRRPRLAP